MKYQETPTQDATAHEQISNEAKEHAEAVQQLINDKAREIGIAAYGTYTENMKERPSDQLAQEIADELIREAKRAIISNLKR